MPPAQDGRYRAARAEGISRSRAQRHRRRSQSRHLRLRRRKDARDRRRAIEQARRAAAYLAADRVRPGGDQADHASLRTVRLIGAAGATGDGGLLQLARGLRADQQQGAPRHRSRLRQPEGADRPVPRKCTTRSIARRTRSRNSTRSRITPTRSSSSSRGKGQEPLGKIIRDRILDQFKIPGALNVTDAIKPVTDAMSAHLKKQIASAEEYEKITVRISHNWTTIANAMKFDVMNSGLIKGLKWLDEFMEKWKKAAQASPKSAEDKGRGVASQRPPSAPVTRPQGYTPYSPRSGIPPKPQQLLGDGGVISGGGGRADMSSIPSLTDALKSLPAGKSEQSNFAGTGWRGLPISTNVDDQRGQNLLETQNDETKTLIGELRRLNALLAGEERPQGQKYGALAMPGGGRAGIPGASGYPRGGGPPGGNPPGSSGNPPPTTPGGTTAADPRPLRPAYAAMGGNHDRARSLRRRHWRRRGWRRSGPARQPVRTGADEGRARGGGRWWWRRSGVIPSSASRWDYEAVGRPADARTLYEAGRVRSWQPRPGRARSIHSDDH